MQARLLFPANSPRQAQMLWPNRFALACHFQSSLQKHNGLWISANEPPNITARICAPFSDTLRRIIHMGEQASRGHEHGVLWRASAKARNITRCQEKSTSALHNTGPRPQMRIPAEKLLTKRTFYNFSRVNTKY